MLGASELSGTDSGRANREETFRHFELLLFAWDNTKHLLRLPNIMLLGIVANPNVKIWNLVIFPLRMQI